MRVLIEAKPRPPAPEHSSGVSGILVTYVQDRKFRAGRQVTYYSPAFRVHGSKNGRVFHKSFRLSRGYEKAWWEAVEFYAKERGLPYWSHLKGRVPDPDLFRRLRLKMRRKGPDIPIRAWYKVKESLEEV